MNDKWFIWRERIVLESAGEIISESSDIGTELHVVYGNTLKTFKQLNSSSNTGWQKKGFIKL